MQTKYRLITHKREWLQKDNVTLYKIWIENKNGHIQYIDYCNISQC